MNGHMHDISAWFYGKLKSAPYYLNITLAQVTICQFYASVNRQN